MAPTTNYYEVLFLFFLQAQNTRLISKSAKSKSNFRNREKEQKETPKQKQ
jgi:hypothetical protein